MSEAKSALIIANYRYQHPDLCQLVAPQQDAESLARVLGNPTIGGFQVRTLINESSHKLNLEIESFFDDRTRDDLLLLYFSGHGIKDADGQLYFATVDTQLVQHNVRRATAVAAQFVNEVMSRSRSRRQILLLDCCYSGAFKQGMLAKGGKRVGVGEQLEGQGRVVLTASDALQYSFEGGQVEGEGVRSVFTRTLVRGLETGEADLDRDGLFSLDEVYDYVYATVANELPEQKPTKMGYVAGKIFIGNNPSPQAAELPSEVRESVEDARPWVRLGAVHHLGNLLAANNRGVVLAARKTLASMASADDSQQVRAAAAKQLLELTIDQANEEQTALERTKKPAADTQDDRQANEVNGELEQEQFAEDRVKRRQRNASAQKGRDARLGRGRPDQGSLQQKDLARRSVEPDRESAEGRKTEGGLPRPSRDQSNAAADTPAINNTQEDEGPKGTDREKAIKETEGTAAADRSTPVFAHRPSVWHGPSIRYIAAILGLLLVITVLLVVFYPTKDPVPELEKLGWKARQANDFLELRIDGPPPKGSTTFLRHTHQPLRMKLGALDTSIADWHTLKNLSELDLSDANIADLSPLKTLTSLSTLKLNNTQVSDLSPLSGLTNLSSLELINTKVTDISPLAHLNNLLTLDLSHNQISDISALGGMPHLSSLKMLHTKIADISALKNLHNLAQLEMCHTEVADLTPLADIASLSHLRLEYAERVSSVSALKNLTKLSTLVLTWTHAADFETLQNLRGLTTLDLEANSGLTDISWMREFTNLAALDIGLTEVKDLSVLERFADLSALSLSSIDAPDSSLVYLENMKKLSFLDLAAFNSNKLTDISPLRSLRGMSTLDLNSTHVSDISALSQLSDLSTLDLAYTHVSDLSPLKRLTKLSRLDLIFTKADPSQLKDLGNLDVTTEVNLSRQFNLSREWEQMLMSKSGFDSKCYKPWDVNSPDYKSHFNQ